MGQLHCLVGADAVDRCETEAAQRGLMGHACAADAFARGEEEEVWKAACANSKQPAKFKKRHTLPYGTSIQIISCLFD